MDFHKDSSVVLVIESLQDPGNLGTLLRSAEAFGVRQVFVTPDTVNRWNPKVVRASAGSVFRMPMLLSQSTDHIAALKQRFPDLQAPPSD